jgi:hypothetical protein
MKTFFAVWVVALGGLIAADGIWHLVLALWRSDRRPTRQAFALPAAELLTGVGLSFWILLPWAIPRLLAVLAGTGGLVAASYLRIGEARRQNPKPGGGG